MVPINIIGHAGCGKTTLIVDLIKEFIKRDIKVGSLKHSAHVHDLDPESMKVAKAKQLNSFKRCENSLLTNFILDLTKKTLRLIEEMK